MTTAVVVQARMTSSRFPGKVVQPLAGRTVLEEVLRRCHAIPGVDVVCCAVPFGDAQQPVVDAARRSGAEVFAGSETDVLRRYLGAAKAVGADIIMRVTSDCPLVAPEVCGNLLSLRQSEAADYACNNMPPSFPHGLDCEVFTIDALSKTDREARTEYEREHVTPWLRNTDLIRRAVLHGPGSDVTRHRWTLDYPEDYQFLVALFAELPDTSLILPWQEIAMIVASRPEIAAINALHRSR